MSADLVLVDGALLFRCTRGPLPGADLFIRLFASLLFSKLCFALLFSPRRLRYGAVSSDGTFYLTSRIRTEGTACTNEVFGDPIPSVVKSCYIPGPAPQITSLSRTSGLVGDSVVINGSGFGTSQVTSTVKFGSAVAPITS